MRDSKAEPLAEKPVRVKPLTVEEAAEKRKHDVCDWKETPLTLPTGPTGCHTGFIMIL